MTITVLAARNELTANAGQTIFNYTFKIFSITDLNVYITPAGQDANDSTDLTTAFTVLGVGDEDGGTITLTVGANLNDLVTIVSNIPSSRTTDYQNNGDFRPDVVNDDFDRVVSLVKQFLDTANRGLALPQSQQGPKPLSLPNPVSQAIMRWKSDLSGLENLFVSQLSPGLFPNDAFTLQSALSSEKVNVNVLAGQVYLFSDRGDSIWDTISGTGSANGANIVAHDTLSLSFTLRIKPVMFASWFGLALDGGVTDDTAAFAAMLAVQLAQGIIIDGENKTTRLKNIQSLAPTLTFRMHNWDIITGSDYTNQLNLSFTTDVEFDFDNIHVDGERDTRSELEPWSVFATFGGVDSIQPLGVGSFIKIIPFLTNDLYLNKIRFTNCHYQECIEANSFATVFINNFRADFCSNKTYHIFHAATGPADPDTGVTIADDIRTNDCGIMVANFLVDGVAKVRADNFAPQGSFGLTVTFGRYVLTNVYVNNYGSIGVLGDRNNVFLWSNITIFHDDPNAFSNNPSGAMWNESCGKELGNNLEIKVEARDPRETSIDNSLLQTFCNNGEISYIQNVILETTAGSNINKVIRGSHGAGAAQIIDGYSVEATGAGTAIVIANVSGQSNKVSLLNGRVRGGDIELRDSLNTTVTNLDSVGLLKIKAIIPTPIGNVTLDNVIAGNTDIDACSGDIKVNACDLGRLRMAQAFGSSFDKMSVGGGTRFLFNSIITGGKSCTFGQVETERRVDFVDIERVYVTGGPYKTNIAESILSFVPTAPGIMLQASVVGASMWIQTGTVGAGFTLFNGNVGGNTDIGNDKLTFAWT